MKTLKCKVRTAAAFQLIDPSSAAIAQIPNKVQLVNQKDEDKLNYTKEYCSNLINNDVNNTIDIKKLKELQSPSPFKGSHKGNETQFLNIMSSLQCTAETILLSPFHLSEFKNENYTEEFKDYIIHAVVSISIIKQLNPDRKSTLLNSSHFGDTRMPSSA